MKTKMKNYRSSKDGSCLDKFGNATPLIGMAGPKPNIQNGALKMRAGQMVRGMMKSFKRG